MQLERKHYYKINVGTHFCSFDHCVSCFLVRTLFYCYYILHILSIELSRLCFYSQGTKSATFIFLINFCRLYLDFACTFEFLSCPVHKIDKYRIIIIYRFQWIGLLISRLKLFFNLNTS